MRLSPRVLELHPSPTIEVSNRAKALIASGVDVVDFGIGEPDFRTPECISNAAKQAIDDGQTKYTSAAGIQSLREAIAARYNRRYGTALRAGQVVACSGAKQALFDVMLALLTPGDEVIIPTPYWVSLPEQVSFAGGMPRFASTGSDFRPTLELIASVATKRTRALIINSPNNPTGAVIESSELELIVEWCVERDIVLIFDETYDLFVYGSRKHSSAAPFLIRHPEHVVIVNSLSKTYAMTGWRLGYVIASEQLIDAMICIQAQSTSNPTTIAQYAGVAALCGSQEPSRRMFEEYAERRAWIVPAVNAIRGFQCAEPDGAFYLFPNIELLGDSASIARFLLEEAGVAVVPGVAFGDDRFIRMSYTSPIARMREGLERISRAVARL